MRFASSNAALIDSSFQWCLWPPSWLTKQGFEQRTNYADIGVEPKERYVELKRAIGLKIDHPIKDQFIFAEIDFEPAIWRKSAVKHAQ